MKAGLRIYIGVVLLAAQLGVSRQACGEVDHRTLAALQVGMRPHQVVELLGAPDEKQEFEVKRENLWVYPELKILFKEGSVIAIEAQRNAAELAEQQEQTGPAADEQIDLDSQAVKDILSEIMNAEGQGGGGSTAGSAPKLVPK